MESETKKNRSANYTSKEKELLVSLVAKYKYIVENKKTDGTSVREKNKIWQKISNEFNAVSPNLCYRTTESLKKLYENQKKELRKKVGRHKTEPYFTGGGHPPEYPEDPSDDLLLNILHKKSILYGVENPFDSDNELSKLQWTSHVGHVTHKNESRPQTQLETPRCLEFSSTNELNSKDDQKNNIEIIFADNDNAEDSDSEAEADTNTINATTQKVNSADHKATDLRKPISKNLKHQRPTSEIQKGSQNRSRHRRRPHSTIRTFSASTLRDKYKKIVEQKLVNLDYLRQEHQLRIEFLRQEHELKMKSLELDVEIKKKQLEIMNRP